MIQDIFETPLPLHLRLYKWNISRLYHSSILSHCMLTLGSIQCDVSILADWQHANLEIETMHVDTGLFLSVFQMGKYTPNRYVSGATLLLPSIVIESQQFGDQVTADVIYGCRINKYVAVIDTQVGRQDSSPNNDHQGDMTYLNIWY